MKRNEFEALALLRRRLKGMRAMAKWISSPVSVETRDLNATTLKI